MIYLCAFALIMAGTASCESQKEYCKQCRYCIYVNGQLENTYGEAEYCGSELIAKENAPDTFIGNTVTRFECDD
jgi:hypothetical protein